MLFAFACLLLACLRSRPSPYFFVGALIEGFAAPLTSFLIPGLFCLSFHFPRRDLFCSSYLFCRSHGFWGDCSPLFTSWLWCRFLLIDDDIDIWGSIIRLYPSNMWLLCLLGIDLIFGLRCLSPILGINISFHFSLSSWTHILYLLIKNSVINSSQAMQKRTINVNAGRISKGSTQRLQCSSVSRPPRR